MDKYVILVADDSPVMRKKLTSIIQSSPLFQVTAIARNGADTIEKIERLQPVLVVLDIDMPVMDGVEALRSIMNNQPRPVIMMSESYNDKEERFVKSLGAAGYVSKSALLDGNNEKHIKEFLGLMQQAIKEKVKTIPLQTELVPAKSEPPKRPRPRASHTVELVIIGCSTGGPSALQAILPFIPANFPAPILVIQHMPLGFTKPLADRLNNSCELVVKEAEDGEKIQPGFMYVAPAGFQTTVDRKDGGKIFHVTPSTGEYLYKPCVDVTLWSAAPLYKDKLLTAILTGMGVDGTKGCKDVKAYDGYVIAESHVSCVVFGMPKSVIEAGYADEVIELKHIYKAILKHFPE